MPPEQPSKRGDKLIVQQPFQQLSRVGLKLGGHKCAVLDGLQTIAVELEVLVWGLGWVAIFVETLDLHPVPPVDQTKEAMDIVHGVINDAHGK